jgi:hypothetical protein
MTGSKLGFEGFTADDLGIGDFPDASLAAAPNLVVVLMLGTGIEGQLPP